MDTGKVKQVSISETSMWSAGANFRSDFFLLCFAVTGLKLALDTMPAWFHYFALDAGSRFLTRVRTLYAYKATKQSNMNFNNLIAQYMKWKKKLNVQLRTA